MPIIDKISVDEAGGLIRSNTPLVLLVGSGVSGWEPTALPTGQQFTQGVLDLLLQEIDWSKDDLDSHVAWKLLQGVPFEVLKDTFPDPLALQRLIARLFHTRKPNPVHEALAISTSNGDIESIITTNYDSGLDGALIEVHAPLTRVVFKSDLDAAGDRIYFKAHGSADPGEESSIVHCLRLEGRTMKGQVSTFNKRVHIPTCEMLRPPQAFLFAVDNERITHA